MKASFRRTLSTVLVISMLVAVMPVAVIAEAAALAQAASYLQGLATAQAAGQDLYTLDNGYIKVTVSAENGGFAIWTQDGDRLNKDDNNKSLLYHSGEYDTSFTSFQVTYPDGKVKEYLFGGDYSYEGSKAPTPVVVSQDATGISAAWTVEGITFTQRIELANVGSNEHGMVRIAYSVSSAVPLSDVKVRVLLDTALGMSDCAYYEVIDENKVSTVYERETVLQASAQYIPANLFAYDNPSDPSIVAYAVNPDRQPYQVAFAHWNNLASTLFGFAPDPDLTFTTQYNIAYRTADSACALYYDMGAVSPGNAVSMSTYYGVYSNEHVTSSDSVAINVTAPTALTLTTPDKKSYQAIGQDGATFTVLAGFTNIERDGAEAYERVAVAVYCSNGITPLDDAGNPHPNYSYSNPYVVQLLDFQVGETRSSLPFSFNAQVGSEASYRKVEFRVFRLNKKPDGAYDMALVKENLLGATSLYILCPGGDGDLPQVTFTGASPKILYYEGNRRLTLTGNYFNLLEDKSKYELTLKGPTSVPAASQKTFKVLAANISFSKAGPDARSPGILEAVIQDKMPPGDYVISLEFGDAPPEGFPKSLTAPALRVTMSEDPSYRNDVYGIIAVGQIGTRSNSQYEIRAYSSEEGFKQNRKPSGGSYGAAFNEVLLVFRGAFTLENGVYKGTSLKSKDNNGNVVINNPITLNSCIDFDNGTVSIYYEGAGAGRKVCVDFDGDLWTSTSRTSIWSGVAALTELKNGTDYGLVPYNMNGERLAFSGEPEEPITLIWPFGLGLAQTIAGMVFKLTYGSLGIMYYTTGSSYTPGRDFMGYLLSFSASMDLSFLVPAKKKSEEEKAWDKMNEFFSIEDQTGTQLRHRWAGLDFPSNYFDEEEKQEDFEPQASVMVDNILYGCGRGFIGFRCKVNVGLPAYIDAMPTVKATLDINTIGDWSFCVDGTCKFTTIEIEVSILIKSYKGAPIPDKLYFYIAGFEPGINVDGFGVLWITGGGGGFDNLYDTIFASNGIPPLKLLLSISFDIIKVMSARADLSLSLRGLGFKASNISIKYTSIVVLKSAALEFQWYPGFYFMASVSASLLDVINGSGYIVIIHNEQYKGFVEFFVRAKVSVPKGLPFEGTEIAQVDLGVNIEKIWGAAALLGLKVGIVYYWAGDFEFGFGAKAEPTFPELLGYEDVPVYYDEETGRTLYMRVGTNMSLAAVAEVGEIAAVVEVPVLMGANPWVRSDPYKLQHQAYLDMDTDAGQAAVLSMVFAADSLEDAQALVSQITINDKADGSGNAYGLVLHPDTGANSTLTYDSDKKMATLWVAFPDASNLDKTWHITTPVATDIVLYGVAAIPELTSVNGTLGPDGRNVAGTWDGTGLNELDSVSFYLTTDDGQGETLTDGGFYLGTLEQPKTGAPDEQDIRDRQATFPIPGDLPTGDYYVRAVYTEADAVKGTITSSTASVSWVNTAQPDDPDVVTIANAGDLMFRVDVQNDEAPNRYDGYILNVYERGDSGHYVPTPFVNLVREKQSDGSGGMVLPPLFVGGRVSGVDDTGQPAQHALEPGKSYKVGVRAFKNVYDSGGTTVLFTVCSGEVLSGAAELRAVTPPVIEIASSTPHEILTRMEPGQDDEGNPAIVPAQRETFAVPDVEFVATSSVPVAGTWTLDSDAQVGEFGAPTTAVNISLAGLADGDHTLLIQGKDEEGDSFRFSHSFTVDTMPPKLMLSSPTNGGFFDQDGSLLIAGVSDPGALFTVVVDGVPLFGGQPKTVAELGGSMDNDGVFSFTCNVGPGVSSHEILILAADEMGNFAKAICQVSNRGLADISELDIYMDGQLFSNNNLRTNVGRQTQLTLVASTGSGSRSPGAGKFVLTDSDLVDWQAFAVRGTVTVDSSGLLTVGPGSIGYVVGSYRVAEGASMTAAATFGAEAFDGQASRLVTGATIGGQAFISVSGAGDGYFVAGDHVGITSVPSPGYRFVQWSSSGGPSGDGTFLNQYAASTTFVMPDGDVTVTAHFAPAGFDSPPDDEDEYAGPGASIWANAGQLVTLVLPEDAGDDEFVPYYLVNGTRVIVPLSKVEDGKLVFVAPVNGLYGYLRYTGGFDDVGEHWASRYIAFAAARGLFGGVGEGLFAPNSSMTRAMFVTVLSRLDGIGGTSVTGGTPPGVGGGFPDVPPGQWYSEAVAWASQNGIVGGHDDGTFGPDQPITREQMCAIFLRYLKYKTYNLDLVAEKASFGDEADISQYALEAVHLCQQFGLIQGKPDNVFDPKANSTRAEACTVFFRLVGAILESLR